jgi:hypothetical protein
MKQAKAKTNLPADTKPITTESHDFTESLGDLRAETEELFNDIHKHDWSWYEDWFEDELEHKGDSPELQTSAFQFREAVSDLAMMTKVIGMIELVTRSQGKEVTVWEPRADIVEFLLWKKIPRSQFEQPEAMPRKPDTDDVHRMRALGIKWDA